MSPPGNILVLGAGELGMEIIRSLIGLSNRHKTEIGVMLRPSTLSSTDAKKRQEVDGIKALGVHIIAGDLVNDSPSLLSSIFRQYHTIISCTGMTFPPGTQLKVAKAVVTAGVRRYFPWQFGLDYDSIGRGSSQNLFDEQIDVRDFLRSQTATDWTIVSTGMFLTYLFEPAFGVVSEDRLVVTAIGSWENRITVTSPQDIGKCTADLVFNLPDAKGVVYTAGDTVSMKQLADIVENAAGKTVKRVLKTVPQLTNELASDPDNGTAKYRVVFAEGKGVAWDKETSFNAKRGIETMTVEKWLE